MAAPTWITKSGSLGIAVQLEPFNVDLKVQTGTSRATFRVISGELPPGLSLSERGNIAGYPIGKLGGIPLAVNEDTTFTFVVRCTNEIGQVADRTFAITVTGEVPPVPKIFNPAPVDGYQDLGSVPDGTWISIDLTGYDVNPGDRLSYQVVSGSLPLGLTVNDLGNLTGYVEPSQFTLQTFGFDVTPWDDVGFDFQLSTEGQYYYFDLSVSDGKIPVIVPYKIFAQRLNASKHKPVILNRNSSLGTYVDENHFYHQFAARDFDGDQVGYEIVPIVRVPTVVGGNLNPAVTAGTIFAINQNLSFSTTGTATNVYDILDHQGQPKIYTDSSTLLVKVAGTVLTAGTDYEILGNTLKFLGSPTPYDVNGKTIQVYEGTIYVGGTGTVSVSDVVTAVNNASLVDANLRHVVAKLENGHIVLFTTDNEIVIQNVTGTPLTDLGISSGTYARNTQDVDVAVTANASQPVPAGLDLNAFTGWLYGYINAIGTGSETYNFYLRVFKRITEPSSVTIPVDYATYYPFTVLNGRTQAEMDELGLDVTGTNFQDRSVIFAQQENYRTSYTGLLGNVYQTDPDSLMPAPADLGWVTKRYLTYARQGDTRITHTVQATVTGATFQLDTVTGLTAGLKVTGTGVTPYDHIDTIDTVNNTITVNSSHTVTAGTVLNFDHEVYDMGDFYTSADLELDLDNVLATAGSQYDFQTVVIPGPHFGQAETIIFYGNPPTSSGKNIKVFDVKATGYTIPGWTQSQADHTVANKRGGIWRFQMSDRDQRYYLIFDRQVQQSEVVVPDRLINDLATSGTVRRHQKLVYESEMFFPLPQTVPAYNTDRFLVYSATGNGTKVNFTLPTSSDPQTVASVTKNDVLLTVGVDYTITDNILTFATAPLVTDYIKVYGAINNPYSQLWPYEMIVNSSNDYLLSWNTGQDLGTIISGKPSTVTVSALNAAGGAVNYQLVPYNTQTVNGTFNNTDLIVLDSVSELVTGMSVLSDTATLINNPMILEIIPEKNQIKLSSQQTVADKDILKFLGNDLPRGIDLNANGELQGRASHQHWYLADNTTFDGNSTTFDRTYVLNIQASTYLNDPYLREISRVRSFRLQVADFKTVPSSNLYLEFLLRPDHRQLLQDAIYNDQLVPDEHLFRGSDAWWGRQDGYRMLVAYGIDTAQAAVVQGAVAAYHHKRHYHFPSLAWAQALDSAGNVEYEVIYLNPVGEFTNSDGTKLTGDIRTTRSFTQYYDTKLSADLNVLAQAGDVTGISLSNTARLEPAMVLSLATELMVVDAIDPVTGAVTVVRGYNQTVPVSAAAGAPVTVYLPSALSVTADQTAITTDSDLTEASSDYIRYLKPASLPNMQARLRQILGNNNRNFLPTWMTTKQPDGKILNYTLAVPLVYVKPGTGKLVLYKLQQAIASRIATQVIDGLSDRYYWDDGLAANWNKDLGAYYANLYTTFDKIATSGTFNVLGEVDLAVTARFNQIDGARSLDLRASGLLDGYRGPLQGLKIVFYQQEKYAANQYDFYEYEGWARVLTPWESAFSSTAYEGYEVITGYHDLSHLPAAAWASTTPYNQGDYVSYGGASYYCIVNHTAGANFTDNADYWVPLSSGSVNQRAGIWTIEEDNQGVVHLQFDQAVSYTGSLPWDSVVVKTGVVHGGTVISLVSPGQIDPTYTVPGWLDRSTVAVTGVETRFDARTTQFFDRNTDEFQKPDDGAKYIVFKNQSFIDRGTVDV